MRWNDYKENQPTWKDMPFLAKNTNTNEVEIWEDSDWFHELDDKERSDNRYWITIKELCKIMEEDK